ncbi:hypothetical protein UFOVP1_14 [uncultured Caudovirales phage]|uniref:Uncharacterized protein n=1 Tax=uncultured Caudovirales phage TaxID=2100421 RepID=A0A6J5KKY2_9CAUD|nr:hypothetical protein UFOVP1_14 [uncultured Caudovirales phage]
MTNIEIICIHRNNVYCRCDLMKYGSNQWSIIKDIKRKFIMENYHEKIIKGNTQKIN